LLGFFAKALKMSIPERCTQIWLHGVEEVSAPIQQQELNKRPFKLQKQSFNRSRTEIKNPTTTSTHSNSSNPRQILPLHTNKLETLQPKWESPWRTYERVYDLLNNGTVIVAIRKHPGVGLADIKSIPEVDSEKALYMFRHLCNKNIVAALEVFLHDSSFYIAFEHMPLSLEHLVRGPKYPTEKQLTAIIAQVSYFSIDTSHIC
jgi:hypothetical protein